MVTKAVEDKIKVEWQDIKPWTKIFDITHGLMLKKFTPHFQGYEDDLKQEMMIVLIKAIRRIKKGEIKSEQNYIITVLKYAAYKLGRKIIEYDRTTSYLTDILKGNNRGIEHVAEWLDLFDLGVVSYDSIFSAFETFEEQYMIMLIIKKDGYTRKKLREELRVSWGYINTLESRVKEKLVEIIKMYTN